MPVPAATKPPMVVIHWGPAVESRTQVNVDVDDGAGFGLPPADRGGVVACGLRGRIVLDGGAVEEPWAMVGLAGWWWREVGVGLLAGPDTGCVPFRNP